MKPQLEPNIKLKYDGKITIAVGSNRKEIHWKNKEVSWSSFLAHISQTTRTAETFEEYKKLTRAKQGEIKDVGGFVGGSLKGGRRKAGAVGWRQLLTLDADYATPGLWDSITMLFDFACAVYSTHKHSTDYPRFRLIIPLSRAISADEYPAIARRVAADIGIDYFDDTTYEPHRLMYWPSTSKDGDYFFKYQDGPWLDPDEVLNRYEDWRDPSFWPESTRAKSKRQKLADKQGNPLEKPGLVGAFCKTYTISEVIEEFLSDIYTPTEIPGRYTYIPGSSVGGLVVYDNDLFAYSHHGTDPVGGILCNAFDLVRLHKFGELDEEAEPGTPTIRLPSYTAMIDLVSTDPKVKITIGEEKLVEAQEVFGKEEDEDMSWVSQLETNRKGEYANTIENVRIILENDKRLASKFGLNDFSHRAVIKGDLPWKKDAEGQIWSDADDSALRHYLESIYGITGKQKIIDALNIVMDKNRFHPVREYLESLKWDGVPRLDTLLIDYLGAEDTEYVRTATKKAFTAAAARIYVPGVKYDYMLILSGPQGIGKSSLINKIGKEWYSDSLTGVGGKEAYEQLQGYWLIEMGELTATKKAEVEAVKHFISKQEDVFREAYAKRTSLFPRQCVFFGTTNDKDFLRDKTGNRRFWPVDVGVNKPKLNIWKDLDSETIDQLWAEAVYNWKNGETLYPDEKFAKQAMEQQESHTERSGKAGLIQEYLDTLLPEDWENWDIAKRRSYLHGMDFGETPEGKVRRNRVCAMEVWMELFNGDPKQLDWNKSKEINDILRNTPGWKPYDKSNGIMKFGKIYGAQRGFIRCDE